MSPQTLKLIQTRKGRHVEHDPISLVDIFPLEQWIDAMKGLMGKCKYKHQKNDESDCSDQIGNHNPNPPTRPTKPRQPRSVKEVSGNLGYMSMIHAVHKGYI